MENRTVVMDGVYQSADDQLDADTANEFASFIDDMNSTENADAWITVMRIPTDSRGQPMPNSKHLGQLFNEPLGSSSVNDVLERIRRDYIRPGENSITVRIIGKQQGKQGLKFNRIYTVEKANTGPKGGEGNSVSEIAQMMLQMQRAADERAERFERLLAAQQTTIRPAGENLVDSLVKLAPLLTPVLTAVLGRPPIPMGDPAASMLATLKAFKEARNLFDGGGSDSGDTLSTVKAVAEAIGPGLRFLAAKEEQRARLPAPQAPTALPGPSAAPPPVRPPRPKAVPPKAPVQPTRNQATPPNNTNEAESMELKQLRENIETLAALCDDGQDPKSVAEMVVNSIDEDQLEELYTRVSPENFVAQIKVLCSKAVTGRELWFEKLRAAIMDQFEADPDAEESEAANESSAPVESVNGSNLAAAPVDLDAIPDAGGKA